MSSRRSLRQLVVAVVLGVMVGGGLMAITPAGAEVSQSLATSWKKIWKNELKPLASKTFYTKKKSDSTFATKAESAAAAAGAQAAANSATDSKLGNYYSKGQSDGRYAPAPAVVRGVWALSAAGTTEAGFTEIVYPQLNAVPTVRVIPLGGAVPSGCGGTAAAPDAAPGYLCVFESARQSMSNIVVTVPDFSGTAPTATVFGTTVWASGTASVGYVTGTYALRPANGFATGAKVAPTPARSGNAAPRP
ncbi:hypothetical protein [Nocardioides sp.]|uniref:hypothetical protein n=1 Tax=Nocardioides sp. TaxID=35761 RepID=UPI0035AE9D4A